MKSFLALAAVAAFTETELAAKATPNQKAIEKTVKAFAAKMRALKAAIKLQKAEDDKIRKAFFKKHAKKVKGWIAQRKAMKAKFQSIMKNVKAALKKAGIKAQVQQLKAMDKKLAMTVKKDVTAFMKEGHKLDMQRKAVWMKVAGPKAKAVAAQGKKMMKAIFA